MKTIFYSFSEDATNSQKANLCKLLQIREKKGIIKRIKRGKINVQDNSYDAIVELIKKYNGIIDNPSELSDLTDGSLAKKLLKEIEQVNEKFSKLEISIFKLNANKENQEKKIDQINEGLEKLERKFSNTMKAITELKTPTKKKAATLNDNDLETVMQSVQEIKKEIVGRIYDFDARLNALEELVAGKPQYF